MKLSEVMKDSKVKIHAQINGHGILLITKAAIGVRDGLLVESLTYFDQDLVFREPTKVVAVNKRDGRSYEFEAASIGPVTTRYGKFHLIRCPGEGEATNRRKSERYDIDRLGVIRINRGGDMRNALIYDISMKGIALILDSEAPCKVGDHVAVSFRYDPNYFHFYACEATVVRIFSINGQVAIGCRMDSMGPDLITLISNKRREKAGIAVEDMLGMTSSPDRDIASGDKIPVNYSPPLHKPEILEKRKNDYLSAEEIDSILSAGIEDNLSPASEIKSPFDTLKIEEAVKEDEQLISPHDAIENLNEEEDVIDDGEYLSLEEAADLIPERPAGFKEIEDRTPPKQTGVDPSKTLANAANAAKSGAHLAPERAGKKNGPSEYEGSYNRTGLAVDENLFLKGNGDGFLTPEQIADIIELERIHRSEF